jgi:hypothetical protein
MHILRGMLVFLSHILMWNCQSSLTAEPVPADLSPGLAWPADRSPPSSAEVNWAGVMPPLPPSAYMACRGTALALVTAENASHAIDFSFIFSPYVVVWTALQVSDLRDLSFHGPAGVSLPDGLLPRRTVRRHPSVITRNAVLSCLTSYFYVFST